MLATTATAAVSTVAAASVVAAAVAVVDDCIKRVRLKTKSTIHSQL